MSRARPSEWIFAYSFIKPKVSLSYAATGSGEGRRAVIAGEVDFGGTDAPASDAQYAQAPDLQLFPVLGAAVVAVYNLPSLNHLAGEVVVLSRTVLAQIFAAQIRVWNHPAIAALQTPTVAAKLPNAPITVIVRRDSSGTTNIFTSALTAFDAAFASAVGAVDSWPAQYLNNSDPSLASSIGSAGVIATVTLLTNSITYSSLGNTRDLNLPYAVVGVSCVDFLLCSRQLRSYAHLINRAGETVASAEVSSVQPALASAAFSARFVASSVDSAAAGAWPIAGFTYIALRKDVNARCTERTEMLRFINWFLTADNPVRRAESLGYASLPMSVRTQVLSLLGTVRCGGRVLLEPLSVDEHQGDEFLALIILGSIMCALSIAAFTMSMLRPRVTASERLFASTMMCGGLLLYVGALSWYLVPSNTSVCQARQWFTFVGAAIMLASLFARLFQIHLIWVRVRAHSRFG